MPKQILAYTFAELSPEAQKRAMRSLPPADCEATAEECMDSLRKLCEVAGVRLVDWSIRPYTYSWIRVDAGDAAGRFGSRAFAWIENRIFGRLRQGWALHAAGDWARIHGRYARRYTKPDAVPCCPLTGVTFDEDILAAFRERDMFLTIRERFESIAGIIQRILESEIEYQEWEGRAERAEAYFDGELFTESGGSINA